MTAQRYIVAATPRTGSSLLCEGLWSTDIAGRPGEVFAPDFKHLWYHRWALNPGAGFDAYLRAVVANGTTPNGVFGVKIMGMHVPVLAREAGLAPDRVLDELFPGARFVYIVRRKRHAQALSWNRAEATGEWWRFCDEPATPLPAEPVADPDYIRLMEEHIVHQQAAWERHFALRGIEPVRIEYEILKGDYHGQVARVLEHLGLDPAAADTLPEPRLVRQSADPVASPSAVRRDGRRS